MARIKSMHGEVVIKTGFQIPQNAKPVDIKDDFIVVGESETTGNDHRIAVKDKSKVLFFEDENGVLYMKNEIETEVYCPKAGRHTPVVLPPNIWKIDKRKEFDYLNMEVRNVRD